MSKVIIIVALICSFYSSGQSINIPDVNLKIELTTSLVWDTDNDGIGDSVVDIDGDGEISVVEANNVISLYINNFSIISLEGINEFNSLEILDVKSATLRNVNLNGMNTLKYLDIKIFEQNSTIFDLQGCTSIETLKISTSYDYSLLLPQLPQLTEFEFFFDSLASINLDAMPNVEIINLGGRFNTNPITTNISFLQNPSLKSLTLREIQISNLDLSNNNLIENLTLSRIRNFNNNQLTFGNTNNMLTLYLFNMPSLDVSLFTGAGFNTLESLTCNYMNISSIDLSNLSNLTTLNVGRNDLSNIDLSQSPLIENLNIEYNSFDSVQIPSSLPLKTLNVRSNNLTSLDVSPFTDLELLYISNNLLSSIDLTALNNVTTLKVGGNNFSTLDFSNNIILTLLSFEDNLNLESVNLKSGNPTFFTFLEFDGCTSLEYICIDDIHIPAALTSISNNGYLNLSINSYCSFNPGGDFNEVTGTISIDSDLNGCDMNDPVFPQFTLGVTDGTDSGIITADDSGNYYFPVGDGQHTITPQPENPSYWNISPASITVDFPTQTSPFTQDFCVTANGNVEDLEVVVLGLEDARPGFETDYRVVVKNKGNQTVSGNLTLDYDSDYMNLLNSTPSAVTSNNQLDWSFTDIAPFEMLEFDFTMTLNTPTDANFPLASNDELLFTGTVSGTGNDQDLTDNTMVLNQIVVNSFDPNDKRCLEGEKITPSMVGEYVHYMIRFENTGTASAINVVVKDAINPMMFDVSTFVPLGGSHDYYVRTVGDGNTFEFIHENINLDFNDATNDGYVLFKIKTLPTLTEGDSFSNDAEIYFDFNAPIITNDFITTVNATASIASVEDSSIKIYPNPTSGFLNLSASTGIESVSVMDAQGRILSNTDFISSNHTQQINLTQQGSGIYFFKITTEKGIAVEKVVVE